MWPSRIFFVLLGFVLYLAYSGRPFGYGDYLRRRVARIVPVYLLALLLIVFPPEKHFACIINSDRAVKELMLSATLLQAYVPTFPLTLNLPGWTISVEMAFYLLFPVFLMMQQWRIKWFGMLATALFIASQAIHLYLFPIRASLSDTVLDTIFFSPAIHMSQFLVGMLGGYLFYRLPASLGRYPFLPPILLAICVSVIAFRAYHPAHLSFQVGLMDPLFMLLILSVAATNPAWLRWRPLVFLGEISYGIYILQWPVYLYISAMNERHWHIGVKPFFYTALVALILFATFVYYFFELPLKKMINRSWSGHAGRAG